jgi:hypothetical protein
MTEHKNENPDIFSILGYTVEEGMIYLHIDNDDGHPSGQDITSLTVELDAEFLQRMLDEVT